MPRTYCKFCDLPHEPGGDHFSNPCKAMAVYQHQTSPSKESPMDKTQQESAKIIQFRPKRDLINCPYCGQKVDRTGWKVKSFYCKEGKEHGEARTYD